MLAPLLLLLEAKRGGAGASGIGLLNGGPLIFERISSCSGALIGCCQAVGTCGPSYASIRARITIVVGMTLSLNEIIIICFACSIQVGKA